MPTQSESAAALENPARPVTKSVYGNYAASVPEPDADGAPEASAAPRLNRGARELPLQTRIDLSVARSFFYRLVARAYEYPSGETWAWFQDEALHGTMRSAADAVGGVELSSSTALFVKLICGVTFEDFLTEHLATFGHAARGPNPTNEIEYGELRADPLFQPHRLADLAAFYRAFGLELTDDASERQDHICVELEFMAVLAAKEAYALEHQIENETLDILFSAQKQFLREHLGRWVPAFARRLARATGNGPISALADLTRCFVIADCERFHVRPGNEELVLRQVDEAENLCASCGVHQLPPGALEPGSPQA
jgi:putative dimethyl sulfoxide reductase chaperone